MALRTLKSVNQQDDFTYILQKMTRKLIRERLEFEIKYIRGMFEKPSQTTLQNIQL